MPGSSAWMPYVPQGVKGFDGDESIYIAYWNRDNSATTVAGLRNV